MRQTCIKDNTSTDIVRRAHGPDEGTGTSGTPTALRTEDGAEPGVQEVPVPLRLAAERQSNRDIRCNDDYLEHCSRFGGP